MTQSCASRFRHLQARASPCLVAALVLAGCASSPPSEPNSESASPDVITNPGDLAYLQNNTTASKPHVHDYWGGQNSKVLYEGDFRLDLNQRSYQVQPGDGATVIVGTRWVNMTARFATANPFGGSPRVEVQLPTGRVYSFGFRNSQNGSIPTNDTTNDPPHSRVTRWTFKAMSDGASSALAPIDVHLTIILVRGPGPLSLQPGHPDDWGASRTLVPFDYSGKLFALGSNATSRVVRPNQYPSAYVVPQKPPLIPPNTGRLAISFAYNSSTPPPLHFAPVLSWKGADRANYEKVSVAPTTSRSGFLAWEVTVEPRMWDSPYANETQWSLRISWNGYPTNDAKWMDGDYHLWLVLYREPSRSAS